MKSLIRSLFVSALLISGVPAWGQNMQVPTGNSSPAAANSTAFDTLCTADSPTPAPAANQLGAQIFFRFGGSFIVGRGRGGGDYTDTRAMAGPNNGRSGFATGFGFNLPLMKDPLLGNTISGEVLIDYGEFSNKTVIPVTSALFNQPVPQTVRINQLAIVGAPKYRIDSLGNFRPWIIPVGLAFLVNSPPSNDSSYIDLGLHFGVGADYRITKSISLGADVRYNLNLTHQGVSWLTTGLYLGFDF